MTFAQQVYTLLKQVPAGKVTTYKALAQAMNTSAYQAIGQAVRNNPNPPTIPCHRVVKASGLIGGFMGKTSGESIQKKINLLKKEGVICQQGKIINFQSNLFTKFKSQ